MYAQRIYVEFIRVREFLWFIFYAQVYFSVWLVQLRWYSAFCSVNLHLRLCGCAVMWL